jgi:hypothetical protein
MLLLFKLKATDTGSLGIPHGKPECGSGRKESVSRVSYVLFVSKGQKSNTCGWTANTAIKRHSAVRK